MLRQEVEKLLVKVQEKVWHFNRCRTFSDNCEELCGRGCESRMLAEKKKEVKKVVLLEELKNRLSAYEEPLKDLRDSL
ncbi:hypothetical protein [Mediterraneibacter massiliensis]|uniref:hypothetical protein n=1 Tax=Mediterraneibacter massiliensis TaxID=1720300 RepID=UPI00073E6A41|nr:hypothetical protein [Mediterraneibacter massiliensis]